MDLDLGPMFNQVAGCVSHDVSRTFVFVARLIKPREALHHFPTNQTFDYNFENARWSVLEPTWARFGAENPQTTYFHQFGYHLWLILEGC